MQPILFIDFDGTICFDRFWKSVDPINFKKIQSTFSAKKSKINHWMRGKYTSEEFNRLLSKETHIPYDDLWKIFIADCQSMRINKDILDLIQNLRKRYRAILITDNMDCFTRFTVPALGLISYFDIIINSADNKTFKNDDKGQIFLKLAAESGVNIEECYLMDDSKNTCDTFSELGGTSCLVSQDKPISYWLKKIEHEKRN